MENQRNSELYEQLSDFLRRIINQFIGKQTNSSVQQVYISWSKLINADTNPENVKINAEKKRILIDCYTIFSDPKTRGDIHSYVEKHGYKASHELISLVTKSLNERLLGERKRKYDMSDLFDSENKFDLNNIDCSPIPNGKSSETLSYLGTTFKIQELGILSYDTPSAKNEYMYKYGITKRRPNSSKEDYYEVFSPFIDIDLLNDKDAEYTEAILGELLSASNLKHTNANGYVGKVYQITTPNNNLEVGKEVQDETSKIYKYQISQKYTLEFDPENLSAVMHYTRQQEKNEDDIELS